MKPNRQADQAGKTYFGEPMAEPTATGLLDAIDRALMNYPAPPPPPKEEPLWHHVAWGPLLRLPLTEPERTGLREYVKTIDALEAKLAAVARGEGKARVLREFQAAIADPTPENLEAIGQQKNDAEFELFQRRRAIKGTMRNVKQAFATGTGLGIVRKAAELAATIRAQSTEIARLKAWLRNFDPDQAAELHMRALGLDVTKPIAK